MPVLSDSPAVPAELISVMLNTTSPSKIEKKVVSDDDTRYFSIPRLGLLLIDGKAAAEKTYAIFLLE